MTAERSSTSRLLSGGQTCSSCYRATPSTARPPPSLLTRAQPSRARAGCSPTTTPSLTPPHPGRTPHHAVLLSLDTAGQTLGEAVSLAIEQGAMFEGRSRRAASAADLNFADRDSSG